ncbi:MAG: protein kinase domain-containing protein [Acidithiobacillales bacterium]
MAPPGDVRSYAVTPEQFQKAKEIFHAALERPRAEAAVYVAEACAGDAEIRREVESLLDAAREVGGFLDAARLPAMPDVEDVASVGDRRRRIGPYSIVREIGRGGMGTVYLAERSDREYRGEVALKLVKRGMDTEFILNRFRAERQILASLNHSNIARLLDGGTTDDGLPYFVMEYIEGQSLTEYCESRNLPLKERIALFRIVCSAVQYAHQNLVVHRDIKPSNLMVTRDGIVKLLDFGLAKVLDPQKSGESFYQTVAGVGIFTPEYASPEQVRAETVTTATDVYSLGVVLYELLAGIHPYRRAESRPADLIKSTLETEPLPPSEAAIRSGDASRARAIDGDLDTIILTALRKEPVRRYATVEKLSADLGRHLSGLPVSARPDTLVYRAGKFVRRHRLGVAASLLVGLSLVAGISVALWEARAARQSEALARRRFDDTRALANSLLFELNDQLAALPGSTNIRERLVKQAAEYLDRLSKDAHRDPALQRELASAYERLADLHGGSNASIGDREGAITSLRRAVALREDVARGPDATAADNLALARANGNLSDLVEPSSPEALGRSLSAVALTEAALREKPGDREIRKQLAIRLFYLASVQEKLGDWVAALGSRRRQAAIFEALAAERPDDLNALRNQALGYKYLAGVLEKLGRLDEAAEYNRRAVTLDETRLARAPGSIEAKIDLSYSLDGLSGVLEERNDLSGSRAAAERAARLADEVARIDAANVIAQQAALRASLRVALLTLRAGNPTRALGLLNDGRRRVTALVLRGVGEPASSSLLGRYHLAIGQAELAQAGKTRGAYREVALDKGRAALEESLRVLIRLQQAGRLSAFETETLEEARRELARVKARTDGS